MLTTAEIDHLANLAKLELSQEEKETYARELSGILAFVEQVKEVDTDGVAPTSHVTGLTGGERADVIVECDAQTRERLLDSAPKRVGNSIAVPPVFA